MVFLFPPQYGGIGGSSISTDSLWDAEGDIVVGTGNNAATRLPIGSQYEILVAGAATAEWTDSPVIDGGSA